MTIQEKLKDDCDHVLQLFKEGVFWVAYERCAYLVSQFKTLTPSRRYIKSAGQDVAKVGFPQSVLEAVLSNFTEVKRSDYHIVFSCEHTKVEELVFQEWKMNISMKEKNIDSSKMLSHFSSSIVDRLHDFKIHQATPIECLFFIDQMQKEFPKVSV